MQSETTRADSVTPEAPHASIVIGTRNRGAAIADAIRSIQRGTFTSWELLIVDQSADDATEAAVRPFVEADARIRYLRSMTRGISTARNVGIVCARAEYIAVTDDDCEVAPDWLAVLVRELDAHPDVGFIGGALIPIPYDPRTGYIPQFLPERRIVVERRWPITDCFGASMAVRRAALEKAGLFDEWIGPGAKFSVLEEQDLCHRVLLAGYRVVITPEASVLHFGLRTGAEIAGLWKRDSRGIGGFYAKELRCGDMYGLVGMLMFWGRWLGTVGMNLVTGKRPLKLRQAGTYLWHSVIGFGLGLTHPVAASRHVYLPQRWLASTQSALTLPALTVQGKPEA
ncbi:MAG TPA: glycosyltransferase [Ktedonobacterales bacterium]|nr:glycosyltransferase [Ktedonobacterales bacterium]